MAATTYNATVSAYSTTGIQGSTRLVALWSRTRNKDLPPVIDCGGYPGTTPWSYSMFPRNALMAAGYTIIQPWTGANWGHPTDSEAPSSGPSGTGTAGITDARTWAGSALGLETSKIHLYGTSMGGSNALAWASTNLSLVGGIYLLIPAISLLKIWDMSGQPAPVFGTYPDYSASLADAYGTTPGDRAAFAAASADYDPIRNTSDFTSIGEQISIYAARDDDLIGWDNCVQFADDTGAALKASAPEGEPGGGHLTPHLTDAFDEFDTLRLFEANNP